MRFLFVLTIFLSAFNATAQAKLFNLDQADNLLQVLDAVFDANQDYNEYFDITEKNDLRVKDYHCQRINNAKVFKRVVDSFKILEMAYPDEEFPIEEAKFELAVILGQAPYYHCPIEQVDAQENISNDLYLSMGSGISFLLEVSFH